MNTLFPPPPPPPPITAASSSSSSSDAIVVAQPQYSDNSNIADATPSPSSPSSSSSIVIVIIVVASAIIVSATIYLLLRFIAKRCSRRTFQTFSATSPDDDNNNNSNDVIMRSNGASAACFDEPRLTSNNTLLESLPLFTFGSVTGNLTGVECAVCLSKFELQDQLRLLPLCCHAFHARCIDTWLVSNLTCPLCRSSVNPTDSQVFSKILPPNDIRRTSNAADIGGGGGVGSFRVEIGSVSRRHGRSDSVDGGRRSYSIGSFEYIVDDGYEVSVDSTHRRGLSECTSVDNKESVGSVPAPPGESLAGEVSSAGRSWLRDYVDRLGSFSFSSRTMSFRSSGRFFAGSSRRSDVVVPVEDLEANRIGEEISELFRWLSGV